MGAMKYLNGYNERADDCFNFPISILHKVIINLREKKILMRDEYIGAMKN